VQVAQLRLLASEAEQAAADAGSALRDETRRGQRDQGLARAELAAAKKQIQVCTGPPASSSPAVAARARIWCVAAGSHPGARAWSGAWPFLVKGPISVTQAYRNVSFGIV